MGWAIGVRKSCWNMRRGRFKRGRGSRSIKYCTEPLPRCCAVLASTMKGSLCLDIVVAQHPGGIAK